MTTTDYDYMRSGEIVDGALPKALFVFDLDGTLVDSVYQQSWHGVRRLRARGSTFPSGASIARSATLLRRRVM
jgi:hypothetical protein